MYGLWILLKDRYLSIYLSTVRAQIFDGDGDLFSLFSYTICNQRKFNSTLLPFAHVQQYNETRDQDSSV